MELTIFFIATVFVVAIASITTYRLVEGKRSKLQSNLEEIRARIAQSEQMLSTNEVALKSMANHYSEQSLKLEKQLKDAEIASKEKHDELIAKDRIIKARLQQLTDALSATERKVSEKKYELSTIEARSGHLLKLELSAESLRSTIEVQEATQRNLQDNIQELEDYLQDLKSELDLYTRIKDFVGYGLYEDPEYLYETPERYQVEIKKVRDAQRALVQKGLSVDLPLDIEINGSSKTGSSVLNGQEKLLLRAFNIECDFLLEKLNASNFDRTLAQIQKVAEDLEKNAASLSAGFSAPYIELKFEECRLFYQYKLKKAAQDEEQRAIREQIREEQKAIKEYERAIAAAEKEEQQYKSLLERAHEQMRNAHDSEKGELEAQIRILETQLREAQEKEQRAKSLAEQTRKGHVYVISNIGSFGDEVYKIGLTRRLDPLDRVKELGDASVPFLFDVHAVIYSDDAPAMEASLHKRFDHVRINAVNRKKEFFKVSLADIKSAVDEMTGNEIDFIMTATAEEYYETLRLQGTQLQ